MILNLLWSAFVGTLILFLSYIPFVDRLPFVGVDSFLVTAVGQMYAFTTVFWPMQPFLASVLFMIPFEIGLLIAKLFFGHRIPSSS